jgi:hypothetical protein
MMVQSQGIVLVRNCRVQGSQGRTVQGQEKVSLSHSGSRDRWVRWSRAQELTDEIEKAHRYRDIGIIYIIIHNLLPKNLTYNSNYILLHFQILKHKKSQLRITWRLEPILFQSSQAHEKNNSRQLLVLLRYYCLIRIIHSWVQSLLGEVAQSRLRAHYRNNTLRSPGIVGWDCPGPKVFSGHKTTKVPRIGRG